MEKRVDSGKAYGFFEFDGSRKNFTDELPKIRDEARTPKGLELSLVHMEDFRGDKKITPFAQFAKGLGANYVLTAKHPTGTNSGAADELADALNAAYLSLYKPGARFKGSIIYQVDDRYVTK